MSDAVLPRPPAPRWTRRRVEVLMQVSLVIFGALLAFGFGQWKDQRNEDARARVALDSIRAGVRANRDEVERFLSRQGVTVFHSAEQGYLEKDGTLTNDIFLFGKRL